MNVNLVCGHLKSCFAVLAAVGDDGRGLSISFSESKLRSFLFGVPVERLIILQVLFQFVRVLALRFILQH